MTITLVVTLAITLSLPTGPSLAQENFLDTLKGIYGHHQKGAGQKEGGVSPLPATLSPEDLIAGLKEALRVGSERVVAQLGRPDGYLNDPQVHIPLPDGLVEVQNVLRRFGLSAWADDLETRLNRAAETAAPKTKELFWRAIDAMTLDDAKRIYDGPEDAATRYFEKTATSELQGLVRPVVEGALADAGAVNAYDQLLGQYRNLPFVPDVRDDLATHATEKALEGLFLYLAKEEAAIRKDPVKRTSEILQKVFSR